jgi:signal transduction histidine kinase
VLRRFVRLEQARSTPGHGLGLALVSAIAQAHGARLVLGDAAPGLHRHPRLSAKVCLMKASALRCCCPAAGILRACAPAPVDLPARVEATASATFDPARAAAMARNLAPQAPPMPPTRPSDAVRRAAAV